MGTTWNSVYFIFLTGFVIFGIVMMIFRVDPMRRLRRVNKGLPATDSPAMVADKRVVTERSLGVTTTRHFVTFVVGDDQRLELEVNGPSFGQMIAGDTGTLSRQGTYFLDFDRSLEAASYLAPPNALESTTSPVQQAQMSYDAATVIAERIDVTVSPMAEFATFELSDGRRIEFMIDRQTAEWILPGDSGTLVWQGVRFHEFRRETPV